MESDSATSSDGSADASMRSNAGYWFDVSGSSAPESVEIQDVIVETRETRPPRLVITLKQQSGPPWHYPHR